MAPYFRALACYVPGIRMQTMWSEDTVKLVVARGGSICEANQDGVITLGKNLLCFCRTVLYS